MNTTDEIRRIADRELEVAPGAGDAIYRRARRRVTLRRAASGTLALAAVAGGAALLIPGPVVPQPVIGEGGSASQEDRSRAPVQMVDDGEVPPELHQWSDTNQTVRETIAEPFPEYAGHYVSADETKLIVLVTSDIDDERRDELRRAILDHHGDLAWMADADVRTERARFAWTELHDTLQELNAVDQDGIHSYGINEMRNRVEVDIEATKANRVREAIAAHFASIGSDGFEMLHFSEAVEAELRPGLP